MYIPFEDIPSTSRIWIYQSNRKFEKDEIPLILDQTHQFLKNWAAHGSNLTCSAKIFWDQFLVLTVFEGHHLPSGCSIDSSVHFIKSLEEQLGITLMDRTKVAFKVNGDVFLEALPEVRKKIAEGVITENTLTFNNLIERKEDLEVNWLIPAKNSWLNKYF